MCHVQRTCNKYIYRIKVNCVGVVPELGAHAHWSCDKLRADALLSHGGPLGALVKITQREGSYFHDIGSRSIASQEFWCHDQDQWRP